jgi:hypothetical protein
MKFLTVITLLTALFLGLASAYSANRNACKARNPQAFKAINKFCKFDKIVIPSVWGRNGQIEGKARAWIESMHPPFPSSLPGRRDRWWLTCMCS